MLSHGLLTACLLDSSVESGLNDWEEVLQLFFFGEDQNDEKVEREKTQETNCRRKKKKIWESIDLKRVNQLSRNKPNVEH